MFKNDINNVNNVTADIDNVIHKVKDLTGNSKYVVPKKEHSVLNPSDFELYKENMRRKVLECRNSLNKAFFMEQTALEEKAQNLVEQYRMFPRIYSVERKVIHFDYVYTNENGDDIKISKRQFYAKNAEEKYPHRRVYVSSSLKQNNFASYENFLQEIIHHQNKNNDDFENDCVELLNIYTTQNKFILSKNKVSTHIIASGVSSEQYSRIYDNYINEMGDEHTRTTTYYSNIRRDQCLFSTDGNVIDIDFKNTRKDKYKYHKYVDEKIDAAIKAVLADCFSPFKIVKTANGIQVHYSFGKEYAVAQKDDPDEKMDEVFGPDNWVTLEFVQNLYLLQATYMHDYVSKSVDMNYTHATKIYRVPMTYHLKDDSVKSRVIENVYVADKLVVNDIDDMIAKIMDIAEKNNDENLYDMAVQTQKSKKIHKRYKRHKKSSEHKRRPKIAIPANVVAQNTFLSLVKENTVESHRCLKAYIESIAGNVFSFKNNKASMYTISQTFNRLPAKMFFTGEVSNYLCKKTQRGSNPQKTTFFGVDDNVMYSPDNHESYNVLGLMQATLGKTNIWGFIRSFMNDVGIGEILFSSVENSKKALAKKDPLNAQIDLALAVLKGKHGQEYVRQILKDSKKYLKVLFEAIADNACYEYNKKLSSDYVCIAQKLLTECVKRLSPNHILRKTNEGGRVIIQALSALGIIQQYMTDKKLLDVREYEVPVFSVLSIEIPEVEELVKNAQIIAETDQNRSGRRVSVMYNALKKFRVRELYDYRVYSKVRLKSGSMHMLKVDRYVKSYGLEFQSAGAFGMSLYQEQLVGKLFKYAKAYFDVHGKNEETIKTAKKWFNDFLKNVSLEYYFWKEDAPMIKLFNLLINAYVPQTRASKRSIILAKVVSNEKKKKGKFYISVSNANHVIKFAEENEAA